jgi:hypothetical protein
MSPILCFYKYPLVFSFNTKLFFFRNVEIFTQIFEINFICVKENMESSRMF